ncbi:MAG: stage III sporulation protein AC [Eubacteriaceae bacterium]|nr:stage III sporulation protein AC [Eubacteriaceae bacterium]
MDISVILKIAGIALVTTIINQILKRTDKEDLASLVTLTGVIVILGIILSMLSDLFATVKTMFDLY